MHIKKNTILNILILLFLFSWLFLLIMNIKTYNLWSQVTTLYENNTSVVDLLLLNDAHTLRYALVLHIFELSDYLNISYNTIFSLEIIAINFIIYYLLNKVINSRLNTNTHYLLILISLFVVSLFMNGRITYAFLGVSILVYIFYKNELANISNFKFFLLSIFSLFFMSVSTGTFIVGVSSLILYIILFSLKRKKNQKSFFNKKFFYIILILLLFATIILKYINKNLDYFDGSIYMMLSHGIGKIFYYDEGILFVIILFPFLLIFGIILFFKIFTNSYYISTIPIILMSLVFGMFGHSTLVACYPAVILTIVYFIYKSRRKND